MAALKKHLTIGQPAANRREIYRIEYDFAKDGGATGVLDIATAAQDLVISGFWSFVNTAFTSSGSATLKVGVTGSDAVFMNTTQGAVASLTADAVVIPPLVEGTPNAAPLPRKLAAAAKILQTIGTEVLLTGKVTYFIEVCKP
jgi:hypothetical protein